jgi:Cu/Ag efflux protein CusF
MIRVRTAKSAAWVSLVAISAIVVSSACSDPGPTDHAGRGFAQEVDPVARTVTLDHEDIPGLMKGMTMTFAVAPGVELESIAEGSEVEFVLQSAGDALTVTRIEPVEK